MIRYPIIPGENLIWIKQIGYLIDTRSAIVKKK